MLCPGCKTEQKVRKEGRYCPNCWEEVSIYTTKQGEKLWVRVSDDAPPTALVKHWLEAMSEKLTQEHGRKINFDIHPMRNKHKYMREVAMAESLLTQVDWDIDLAKRAMSYVVDNEWKSPITLTWVTDAFVAASFIVAGEDDEKNKQTSQDHTIELLDGMEDVWD
jgi:hypothetical protein